MTTRVFNAMLNEYRPFTLMRKELANMFYMLKTVNRDDMWRGGELIVPFRESRPNSGNMGSLPAANDIATSKYVRAKLDDYKEYNHALLLNGRDLIDHGGKITEQTFIRALKDEMDGAKESMKEILSHMWLNGGAVANLTADGLANGKITIDRPERFENGQKLVLDDDDSNEVTVYVKDESIDINAGTLELVTARGGSTPQSAAAYTTAKNAKLYYPGTETAANRFYSMKSVLLPAANGGLASIYGKTKAGNTYLQSIAKSGSAFTAANFLEDIFEAYNVVEQKARKGSREIWMSYAHWALIQNKLQLDKSPFNVKPGSEMASEYGYKSITIGNTSSTLKVVAIQELDNDVMMFIDPKAFKFFSNGFLKVQKSPDGDIFDTVRATTGRSYICDMYVFGDLVVNKPANCGIIHSIPSAYTTFLRGDKR